MARTMRREAVFRMLGTVDIYPYPPHEYLGWWVSNVVGLLNRIGPIHGSESQLSIALG
jgi:hypothetical protein